MSVFDNGVETYKGCVIGEIEHMWMDGMLDVSAIVYDQEKDEIKSIRTGYFGNACQNLCDSYHRIDCTPETARKVLKLLKRRAVENFAVAEKNRRSKITKGQDVVVIRGRKIKKGTELNVFWVGERETYKSRQYSWMHEMEEIAGCYDKNGEKVWIKTEYLKAINPVKPANRKERAKYIKEYIRRNARDFYEINLYELAKK